MAGEITITLAWPPRALSPNGREHPLAKYRFQKAAKTTAFWLTKEALHGKPFAHDGGEISVRLAAHPIKGKPAPDDDNLLASLKSQLDGIALALGVNDKLFRPQPIEWAEPRKNGAVVVTLASELRPATDGARAG